MADVLLAEPDDQRRAELVEPWGIIREAVGDYREPLDDEAVDIVDICAPAPARAGIVRDALQAGKDVICEGPAALSPQGFDDLVSAASGAGRRLFICIPHLMIPANRQVAQFIAEEETGEISLGTALVTGDGSDRAEYAPWPDMAEDALPPILADSVHDGLAVLQAWMGEAVSVSAFSAKTRRQEWPDDCSVSFRTEDGALGQITASYRAGGDVWREERRIFAENGSLLVRDDPEDELPLMTFVGGMFQSIPVHNPPFIRQHATIRALWDFIECLDSAQEPAISLEEAARAVAAMSAAAESLETGQAVSIEEISPVRAEHEDDEGQRHCDGGGDHQKDHGDGPD